MENRRQNIVDQDKELRQSSDGVGESASGATRAAAALPRSPFLGRQLSQEVRAQVFNNQVFLKLSFFTVLWLFVAGSIFGLCVETLFRTIQFGGYESRAGLIWGPFSPIYGAGAVILTVVLNRFCHAHNLVIFLIAMIVGSTIEYATSCGMQYFWGAIAWDYSGTFGSIGGRTNFAFGIIWGMLGLIWVRLMMPLIKQVFSQFDRKSAPARVLTVALSVFMIVNIAVTVMALDRQGQRAKNIPATTPWEQTLDEFFPDSFMHTRFENMSVYGRGN